MNALLFPAWEYFIARQTEQHYDLLPVHRRKNLVYMLAMGAIQYSYFREWAGSFTETFYGLKRVVGKDSAAVTTSPRGMLLSLFELVAYPVLRNELDQFYEKEKLLSEMRDVRSSRPTSQTDRLKARAKAVFLLLYPRLRFLEGALHLVLQLRYAYGKSTVYSPWQWLTKLRLERITPQDYKAADAAKQQEYTALVQSLRAFEGTESVRKLLYFLFRRLGSALATGLPILIALFRWNEWWSSTDYAKKKDVLPIPPPPAHLPMNPAGLKIPRNGHCPICNEPLANPAMLNGVVYCYSCIFSSVQEFSKCPVTLLPASPDSIRKIYYG
ncbi:ubiquitin-protein ligase peroxin 12 [Kappamyces sp. JEL0680]|nr:ubiquitin-protein ligase peroxin 12 [Kappamyces sp. JEL0680]